MGGVAAAGKGSLGSGRRGRGEGAVCGPGHLCGGLGSLAGGWCSEFGR